MGLGIGIVGLPNVGKSTLFNALTKTQSAEAANYPFCTIEPNRAIVPVPDPRVDQLGALVKPQKTVHSTVEFVDIAGLVRGASRGEGLGNQFLGNVRDTAAIVHVVRCFEDENVAHVHGALDPVEDVDVIHTELILADLEQMERKIERLGKQVKGDRKMQPVLDLAAALRDHLGAGRMVRSWHDRQSEEYQILAREMQFLTGKTILFAANVDEHALDEEPEQVRALREYAAPRGHEVIVICAKVEEEMAGLTDEERAEFLAELGVEESGLEKVIHRGFRALDLISFFTTGEKEVKAWTIRHGWTAPQAAGTIHTDFEKKFIRAEVIAWERFLALGGREGARAAGEMRLEGKEYVVEDGDVILFRTGG